MIDNPVLRKDMSLAGEGATVEGIALKSGIFILFVVIAFYTAWMHKGVFAPLTLPISIIALIVGLITSFRPLYAPILAPVYAILEGLVIGVISLGMETRYPGIVMDAVTCTFGIAITSVVIYGFGFVEITDRFERIVGMAMGGVFFVYVIDLIMYLFFNQPITLLHEASWKGMLINVIIIGIATARLFVDFEHVRRAVAKGVGEEYECYLAFGITVTLLWLYLEVLRLFGKGRSRK